MPLTNRAPVNAAGQIMVTGTTPTPAWPVLGGMTYEPTTGELAVTSAVPNATDPWVGGLRFTNLGALYIVTTIPSPVFYVGGLPVSTLGQLFMSANPPVGSVGGWPIAGDGGVAGIGSGIGPVPIFWAPLITTLVPVLAGNPTATFTRATTAYVADQDGILRQAIANEARFQGARRVRNLLVGGSSQDFGSGWTRQNCTTTFGVTGPTGLADANTVTGIGGGVQQVYIAASLPIGATGRMSWWVRRRTGTGIVQIRGTDNATQTDITSQLDGTWRRFATPPQLVVSGAPYIVLTLGTVGDAVDATYAQCEDVSGQSNQAPGEYVSVGVLAAPYHGNAIDGVKYFPTQNGNSVAGNVVTEATGAAIPTAMLLGYVAENAATNLCLQSQTFDNAAWTKQFATMTPPNTQTAPDGTLTADTFTDDISGNAHNMFQGVAVTAQPYTFSCYVKQGTLLWVQLNGTAPNAYANFNLATGAIGFTANCTTSVTSLPNGWYRVSITTTPTAGTWFPAITSINANTNSYAPAYSGTGQTMYLWGAQVEASSDPSSYVPTTTVAVVRNTDALTYPVLTNIDGAVATVYTEAYLPSAFVGAQQHSVLWSTGALNAQYYETTKALSLFTGAFVSTANLRTVGAINKNASAWSGTTVSICLNGGAVATVGGFAALTNSGNVGIGNSGANSLRGSIRNVKFYATRLTDVELQGLTA